MPRVPNRPRRTRKIIAYLAASADGYIARRDGGVEWYEIALGFTGGKGIGTGKGVRNYVFSRRPPMARTSDVDFVREPPARFAKRLRATPGKDIWMMGGAGLIGSFLDAGEIDEFVIHVVPILIGEGIPLISPGRRSVRLQLLSARRFSDGVVRVHYSVRRPREAPCPLTGQWTSRSG